MKKNTKTTLISFITISLFLANLNSFGNQLLRFLPPGIDTIAPTISLNGPIDTTIEVHNSFIDPGVTVHDNHTPDSAIKINKTGFVNEYIL